jgi:hypothetical protein
MGLITNQQHCFSVFSGNIKDSEVKGTTDLIGLINDISNPDEFTQCIIDEIRSETDEDKRARMKWQLKGYTPTVLLKDRRRLENIVSYSGLMPLDFDKLPHRQYATELRNFLFDEYPFIYASWLSSSGKGVRALVHIEQPQDKADFQAMFAGFKEYKISDYEFVDYFDNAPKNVVLPLFQSHDSDIKYRNNAIQWNQRYYHTEPLPRNLPPLEKPDERDLKQVYNILQSAINKIVDNGHPQLRGASFALGGYVGANYIDYTEAVNLIDSLIERNHYLSQKNEVYKVTARQMIQQGMSKPLYLN